MARILQAKDTDPDYVYERGTNGVESFERVRSIDGKLQAVRFHGEKTCDVWNDDKRTTAPVSWFEMLLAALSQRGK